MKKKEVIWRSEFDIVINTTEKKAKKFEKQLRKLLEKIDKNNKLLINENFHGLNRNGEYY